MPLLASRQQTRSGETGVTSTVIDAVRSAVIVRVGDRDATTAFPFHRREWIVVTLVDAVGSSVTVRVGFGVAAITTAGAELLRVVGTAVVSVDHPVVVRVSFTTVRHTSETFAAGDAS